MKCTDTKMSDVRSPASAAPSSYLITQTFDEGALRLRAARLNLRSRGSLAGGMPAGLLKGKGIGLQTKKTVIGFFLPGHFRLGNNIATHRRKTGLTQNALGARLGVSAQAVSKWERELAYPDITLLPAIAYLFGITLDELFSAAADTFPNAK